MSQLTPEQAEAKLAEKLVTPLDELSTFSIGVVAEAAETIAIAKAEAAVKALEAAQASLARVAAMKAAQSLKPVSAKEPIAQAAPASPAAAPNPIAEADEPVAPAANVVPFPTPAAESIDRRSPEPRRSGLDRRDIADSTEAKSANNFERRAEPRRLTLGRREDDPSGVHRLLDSVRSASQTISADKIAAKPVTALKVPGQALEPVAHQAGLYAPRGNGKQRKIITPRLVMLFVLMLLFGMYATGNLPQFDQWTDSIVNSAHTHNDQIVNGMVSGWHIAAYVGAALAMLLIVFLIFNSIRTSNSTDDL
jgi:hypothetical protein